MMKQIRQPTEKCIAALKGGVLGKISSQKAFFLPTSHSEAPKCVWQRSKEEGFNLGLVVLKTQRKYRM